MTLGDEIRKLREAAGLSQHQLAEKAKMSRTFLAGLEQGRRERLGADVLFNLSDALNVKADHFRPFLTSDGGEAPEGEGERSQGKRK